MEYVKSFKDLEVYKKSRELSKAIYGLSKEFPIEERYSIIDQIRRSSRSIGAQIAEAWGKRKYEKHFVLKLSDSDSEQFETQHCIDVSRECNYINEDEALKLLSIASQSEECCNQ